MVGNPFWLGERICVLPKAIHSSTISEEELISMPKSSSIYTRVEPELKEQVEGILAQLGLPMASAIHLFLHQVVLHNGLPFSVNLPNGKPLDYSTLTQKQFDTEIEKGLRSIEEGRTLSSSTVRDKMRRNFAV